MTKYRFTLTFIHHLSGSELTHLPLTLSHYCFRESPQTFLSYSLLRSNFFSLSNLCPCPLPVKLLEELSQCHHSFCHYQNTTVSTKGSVSSRQQNQWSPGCQTTEFHEVLEKITLYPLHATLFI